MGLLKKLFGAKNVSVRELKLALRKAERDREQRQQALKELERRREALFHSMKVARKRGDNIEVDFQWEELRQVKAECGLERREAQILNLEVIALKRTSRALERLGQQKDQRAVRTLLQRVRTSGLDDKLMAQEIRDDEYLRELDDMLRDVESRFTLSPSSDPDPEKASFLAEIDAINEAEEIGDMDGARRREGHLKNRLAAEENERLSE